MENFYEPYEVVLSDDNKLAVLVEPDENLEKALENAKEPELMVDVDYDEESEELYLLISVIFGEEEIFFGLPYGEAWESLIEEGSFVIAFLPEEEFRSGKFDEVPSIEIEFDDITLGFVEGANRTAEVLLGETEEE
ncbi:MAG: hypothetical protein N2Z81_05450 [Hydrogenothermaceae bacterium]|nr:hypothetical protein [Hydrogenothermaceae bacterium]